MALSTDEIYEIVDEVVCVPFGVLSVEVSYDPEDGRLVATRYTALDSTDDRWYEEVPDDPDLDDYHAQEFSIAWVPDDRSTREDVVRAVAQLVAYAGAHEFVEWTRIDGKPIADLHAPGFDVSVQL